MTMRRCPRCGKKKPQTRRYFYRKSNGTWDTWCKECKCEHNRIERKRRKEAEFKERAGLPLNAYERRALEAAKRQREQQRAYMERRRSDPEWREKNRTYQRERNRDRYGDPTQLDLRRIDYWLRHEGDRIAKPAKGRVHYLKDLQPGESLPVEPFRQWLRDTFAESPPEIAYLLGIFERDVRRVLDGEARTISIRVVDRAFVTFGRPDLLNALYPLEGVAV